MILYKCFHDLFLALVQTMYYDSVFLNSIILVLNSLMADSSSITQPLAVIVQMKQLPFKATLVPSIAHSEHTHVHAHRTRHHDNDILSLTIPAPSPSPTHPPTHTALTVLLFISRQHVNTHDVLLFPHRINTGYSTVASRIQRNRYAPIIKSTNVGKLSDAEIEIIKRVIKRAEDLERAEEIRIGLVCVRVCACVCVPCVFLTTAQCVYLCTCTDVHTVGTSSIKLICVS